MAGLNTFDNAEQLEALLNKLVCVAVCVGGTHPSQPAPKGDAKFFQRQYGKPDGTEDLRYAALAKWPMTKDKVCTAATVLSLSLTFRPQVPATTTYNRRELMAQLLDDYRVQMTHAGYVPSGKTESNEETRGDCANAIGLPWEWSPSPDFFAKRTPTEPGAALKNEVAVRVMSFNLWHGGEKGNLPLSATAGVIKRAGADIVGLQGTSVLCASSGKHSHACRVCRQRTRRRIACGQRAGACRAPRLALRTTRRPHAEPRHAASHGHHFALADRTQVSARLRCAHQRACGRGRLGDFLVGVHRTPAVHAVSAIPGEQHPVPRRAVPSHCGGGR